MPPKVQFYTEQNLRNAPLPNHGGRYAVVAHGDVIDNVKNKLALAGFNIKEEKYKMTVDGQVAQGVYHLDYGNDAEMGMMFAWSNSYNKTMRFKCGVGGYVFVCSNGVLRGDMGNYSRKHSGTALQDVIAEIDNQIGHAKEHYDVLIHDKNLLQNIILTPKDKGKILGELFAYDEILTLTQVGIVKREIDKPSFRYSSSPDSAWDMYNHITLALKESHPGSYMRDHHKVHQYFVDAYGNLVTAQLPSNVASNVDPEDESPFIEESEEVLPAAVGSDFDIDMNAYGVNFL
jgi:hypothetical protein